MIEVTALKAFTDKETGVFHKKGDSFSLEDARAQYLSDLAVVKLDAPVKPARKRKAKEA